MKPTIGHAVAGAVLLLGLFLAVWVARGVSLRRRAPAPGGSVTGPVVPMPASTRASPAPATLRGEEEKSTVTGTVVGTVLRDGKPVSGRVVARVLATASPGEEVDASLLAMPVAPAPVAEANAGPDGRFEIANLLPASYVFDAAGEDGTRGRAGIDALGEGERREVRIELCSGAEAVRGRVAYLDGRPWRGRVRVLLDGAGDPPYDEANPFMRSTTTDDGGRFHFAGLFGERITVDAIDEGKECIRGPSARLPYHGDYVILVPRETDGVSGRVVADEGGAPIAGAVLTAGDSESQSVFRRVTGEDGRFAIPLPGDRSEIEVRAPGFSGTSDWFDRGAKDLVLHLRRTGAVRGRVTEDGDGRPVSGIEVIAWRPGGRLRTGRTDADGLYEVRDLPAGEVTVYARGSGWIPKGIEHAENVGWNPCAVSVGSGAVTVADLVVVRGARASGHVRAPDGSPVAGAVVSASTSMPYGDGAAPLGALLGGESAVTGADGSFTLTTLVGGVEYAFDVRAAGFPPARPGSRVADPVKAIDLDVRLAPPRWLEVRVVEKGTGTPIADADVTAGTEPAGGSWRREGEASTAKDGVARIGPLAAGTYLVMASAVDHPENWGEPPKTRIPDTEETVRVTLDLEPGFEIAGRVVLPDGTPAGGASVNCDCDDMNVECQTEAADGEGRFHFEGLRRGEHDLWATFEFGGSSTSVHRTVTTAEQDLVLTLLAPVDAPSTPDSGDDTAGREVQVVDPNGRPVPRAKIRFRDPDRLYDTGWTEVVDGRATLDPDRARCAVVFEVVRPTTAGGASLPLGLAWVPVPAGTDPVEVRLPPEAPIEGKVVGPDGRPAASVLLEAMPARVPDPQARRQDEEIVSTARSDEAGSFRLGGLGPEPYRVLLSPPPGCARPEPLVVDGGTRGLVVRLDPGVSSTVTVLDPQGRPVAGAVVSASVGPHESYLESPDSIVTALNEGGIARTGALGTVRLESLAAGRTYDLYVGVPRGRTDVLGLDTPRWTPADTTIQLPETNTVRGVVEDTSGDAVDGAYVRCVRDGERVGAAYTDADGSFVIEGLPAGPVAVEATPPGGDEGDAPDTATAKTAAGATGVRLVVRATVEMGVRIENWSPADADASNGFEALLTREPIADDSPTHAENMDPRGVVRFEGLSPGASYTLWIGPLPDGRIVYARGVQGGGGDVVVRLVSGQALRGSVALPAGARRVRVDAAGAGWSESVDVGGDGRYEFPGLPPGPCRVTVRAEVGGEERTASVDARTGGTVDLDLAAK